MAMIRKLTLKSFKGFSNFEIEFGNFTVLVGENGAGKTTILEALYMAQLAFRRVFGSKDQPQLDSPQWHFNFGEVLRFGISQAKAEDLWFHRQLDQPLELIVDYDVGLSCCVKSSRVDMLGTDLFDTTAGRVLSGSLTEAEIREKVKSIYGLVPELLRPIGALQAPERHMDFNNLESQRAQGHLANVWRNFVFWQYDSDKSGFRNAMAKLKDNLPWAEVLEPALSRIDDTVQILFKHDEEVYDIASGGGGLSTLLSVSLVSELGGAKLILIDEPDAHLHSSLQSQVAKSLHDLAQGGQQIVLATHAPDFIDAVPVECIRWVDRRDSAGRLPTSATRLLERLGALTKAQALQLRNVKVILWLEGESDLEILRRLAAKVHKEAIFSSSLLEPAFNFKEGDEDKVGGYQRLLSAYLAGDVRIVAVRDADYTRLIEDVPRKLREKQDRGARVFVLARKEIENYLLDPTAISQAYQAKITADGAKSQKIPSPEDVRNAVRQWANSPLVHDALKHKFIPQAEKGPSKGLAPETKHAEAEKRFETLFEDEEWLCESVSGKDALRSLNEAFRNTTGIELSALDICEYVSVPADILRILEAIEEIL
ncbi:MAG: AAA family ATPase [Anaerolineae bacterium]